MTNHSELNIAVDRYMRYAPLVGDLNIGIVNVLTTIKVCKYAELATALRAAAGTGLRGQAA